MKKTRKNAKVGVGISIPAEELAEMRRVACIDLSGPAILSLARKGLAAEKQAHGEMFKEDK